jgi:hypothetical protein
MLNKIKEKIKSMCKDKKFLFTGTKVVHIKTNKIYYMFGSVTNKTSGELDGTTMVFYTDGKEVYIRDRDEFLEKFKIA